MKKTILIVILCVLLLCITACGITRGSIAAFGNTMEFASGEEMLNHLAGMWVVDDDAEEKSYYIFRDRQIYITTDTMYSEQVKQMLDKASKFCECIKKNVFERCFDYTRHHWLVPSKRRN